MCWPQFLLPLPMCLWFGICRHTTAVQLINWHTLGGPHLLRFYNCFLLHQTWIGVFQTLPQRLSWYFGVKFRTRIWSRHFIPSNTCFPAVLLTSANQCLWWTRVSVHWFILLSRSQKLFTEPCNPLALYPWRKKVCVCTVKLRITDQMCCCYMTLVTLSGVSYMLVVQGKEKGITYSCTVK